MRWIVRIRPDCEWADTATLDEVYPSRAAALRAVRNDPILRPDEWGNRPHVSVVPVDPDGRVAGCSCYDRQICSACLICLIAHETIG